MSQPYSPGLLSYRGEYTIFPMKWSDLVDREGPHGPLAFGLQREALDVEIVARFTVPGDPASKSRARFSSKTGRHYTPGTTRAAEERVVWALRQAGGGRGEPDGTGSFGVFLGFFCETGQRRDVDNMTKLVMDALTGVVWVDDSQVTEQSAKLRRWVGDDARAEVVVYRTLDQSRPTRPCKHCGKPFEHYPSQAASRQFCNAACGYAYRREQNRRTCAHCGKDFQSKASATNVTHCSKTCSQAARTVEVKCAACSKVHRRPQSIVGRGANNYCDQKCQADYWRTQRKVAAIGTCQDCGGPTSKKSYMRCRACSFDAMRTTGDES